LTAAEGGPDANASGPLLLDPAAAVDVTRPLGRETLAWPGAPPLSLDRRRSEGWRVTTVRMTSHTGTHMDAPAHLMEDGATVDRISPRRLVLPATVVLCPGQTVGPEDLAGAEVSGRAVLLRTRGSALPRDRFRPGYPYLRPEAAQLLRDEGALLVGTDCLSVDPPSGEAAHRTLLEAGIPIVEDLMLGGIRAGDYVLVCLPLRLEEGDGAPVRALLFPPA